MTHLVIIGGSDAGIQRGSRACEIDSSVEPTLVVADSYPNFSICGLPFYLSGEVADLRTLAHHQTKEEIEQAGITLLLNSRAEAIDAQRKSSASPPISSCSARAPSLGARFSMGAPRTTSLSAKTSTSARGRRQRRLLRDGNSR